MNKTPLLKILGDIQFPPGRVVIHPNDGADLNLFQYSYPIKLYTGLTVPEFQEALKPGSTREYVPGELIQSNDCKMGTVELPLKLCTHLGNPSNAILIYHDGSLMLAVK
ncbi:MAG: hypothetical protein LBQ61_03655 [Spirochaetales bacterium]|jgi:hypothetical protein|nr:hypothetical protein [Spirochaetales bacterium]